MRCEDIQELLLTDFLDNELEPGKKSAVDGHLARCAACRDFFAAVRKVNDGVVASDHGIIPAEHVWNRVCARIDEQNIPFAERVRAWWDSVIDAPKPVFIYASAMAVMFVMLVVPVGMYRQQAAVVAEEQTLVQLVFLDDNASSLMSAEDIGSGTAVEQWL